MAKKPPLTALLSEAKASLRTLEMALWKAARAAREAKAGKGHEDDEYPAWMFYEYAAKDATQARMDVMNLENNFRCARVREADPGKFYGIITPDTTYPDCPPEV